MDPSQSNIEPENRTYELTKEPRAVSLWNKVRNIFLKK